MSSLTKAQWEVRLALYDALIERCPRFERKGKSMPYTSANGYMFSLLNKAGEIGIRFSKEVQERYFKTLKTTLYKSYGAVMHGYVLIPEEVLNDGQRVAQLLNESYDHFMSLEPNTHKKK
ncbi:MAG: hypothetical protein AAFX53_08525 [Bacteroidota bacterium]